jgi:quinol---cytochrome c reductase iron-sulfur subunit, bacillus type
MADTKTQHAAAPSSVERRNFLVKTGAAILGGIAALVPIGVGLFTFADPLWRRSTKQGDGYLRITSLDSVPDDGIPRQFAVLSDRTDAWNRFPNEPIGAIYLRRKKGEKTPEAFNAICPHAGCFVAFAAERNLFQCPCHNSAFQLDGSKIEPSPSPRPMDKLNCKLRDESGRLQIWVEFKDFLPGREERIAKV